MRVGPPLRQLPPALRRAAIAPTRRPGIPLTLRRPMIAMALQRPALAFNTVLTHGVFALKLVAGVLAAGPLTAQVTVTIDADDIGGVVTGPGGPEAGVWVIAETTDLGTKFAKMVVTDDQGRYVLPDLPKAKYKVWVRGYGLVDSAKVDSEPGKTLNLRATPAPNAAAAAEYYPAIYWYSMIKVPEKGEFPGTAANGFNPAMKSQGEFLNLVKTNGCVTCHQLGNKATRTIPKALGEFRNGHEAWTRRIQSGQAGLNMVNTMDRMGTQGTLKMFGDWTDRVAKGELPATKPQRPQGVERNAVVTVWDWSNPKAYLHDATAADKRNPTLNANGLVFGATENSTDMVPVLDPVKISVPTAVLRSQWDGIATEQDVFNFFARLPNADKQLTVMPGIAHTSLRSKNWRMVYDLVDACCSRAAPVYTG